MTKIQQSISFISLTCVLIFFAAFTNAKNINGIPSNLINTSSQISNTNTYGTLANDPVPIGRPRLMKNCKYAYREPEYLNPPDPVCTFDNNNFSAQVANGCPRGADDTSGNKFALSVMGMYFPRNLNPQNDKPEFWSRSCTATVIGRDWLITAAHCVASADPGGGHFYAEETYIPLYVVPVQKLSDGSTGVPARLDYSTAMVEKFPVETIYIPYHYNYYNDIWPNPYPEHDYVKQDFALLKLKKPLPAKYKAIDLASHLPQTQSQIWFAGLGVIQGNNIDMGGYPYQRSNNNLNYRNMFYMTNRFPFQGTYYDQNLEEIYTLGTLPINAGPNHVPSAWKFTGVGDSGGPFFYLNPITHNLSIIGTLTGGTDCTWAGFMAPLPYSYTHGPSIPANRELIIKVMNNQAADIEVRHISPHKNAYVLAQGSAGSAVYGYNFDVLSGDLSTIKYQKPIGVYPVQIATTHNFAYIADYLEKVIFVFKKDASGVLTQLPEKKIRLPLNLTDIQIVNGQYLLAIGTDGTNNKIIQFEINPDGSLVNKKALDTGEFPVSIAVAKVNNETFIFIANASSQSIKKYSVSIYELNTQNNNSLQMIQKDYGLFDRDGQPIKIVADAKNQIFILRSGGIDVYKFNSNEKRLSILGHHSEDYSLKSDMIILSDGRLITSGNSLNQYKITEIDGSLIFEKKIIAQGFYNGLAQEEIELHNEKTYFLYSVSNQNNYARTIVEFTSNNKSDFVYSSKYETGDNPSKIIISK